MVKGNLSQKCANQNIIPIFYKLLILQNKKEVMAIVKYPNSEGSGMGGMEHSPYKYGVLYISLGHHSGSIFRGGSDVPAVDQLSPRRRFLSWATYGCCSYP